MQYLQAVIYESMPLFPANGPPLREYLHRKELEIHGYYFPPGVQLTVYSWALHRNKGLFGADAAELKAERWLDKDRCQVLRRCFFSFLLAPGLVAVWVAILHGWMEMLKAIGTNFRNYDGHLQDPVQIGWLRVVLLRVQTNINVVLYARL